MKFAIAKDIIDYLIGHSHLLHPVTFLPLANIRRSIITWEELYDPIVDVTTNLHSSIPINQFYCI